MAELPPDLPADLRVIRHPRATRLKLRIDKADGAPVLVLPPRASMKSGVAFVRDNLGWIAERQAARPAATPFTDGVSFPLQDDKLMIRHRPDLRIGVRRADDELQVSGDALHINRRVTDWLKAEARSVLTATARRHASTLGQSIPRIRIADQKSRWGSRSSTGTISFNWRLILAPSDVLDFVAAHEVAHISEMNHGPAFHRLLAKLHDNPRRAERWLNDNGSSLRAWGQRGE